jgi:hypothetical protein
MRFDVHLQGGGLGPPFDLVLWPSQRGASVWSNSWDEPSVRDGTLDDQLSMIAGVTNGLSSVVPTMLVGRASDLCEPLAVADVGEPGAGVQVVCREIQVTTRRQGGLKLCIDRGYSIQKWSTVSRLEDLVVTTTVRMQSTNDPSIDRASFQVSPPAVR